MDWSLQNMDSLWASYPVLFCTILLQISHSMKYQLFMQNYFTQQSIFISCSLSRFSQCKSQWRKFQLSPTDYLCQNITVVYLVLHLVLEKPWSWMLQKETAVPNYLIIDQLNQKSTKKLRRLLLLIPQENPPCQVKCTNQTWKGISIQNYSPNNFCIDFKNICCPNLW